MQADQPRQHHYEFAHVVLRAIVFRAGRAVLELAAGGGLTALVHESWQRVGAGLAEHDRLPSDGLRAEWCDTPEFDAAVVTLPPARHIAEAHLIALVADPAVPDRLDFFALEHSWTTDGDPATVLARWTRDGRHLDLGAGPRPEPAELLQAIAQIYSTGS